MSSDKERTELKPSKLKVFIADPAFWAFFLASLSLILFFFPRLIFVDHASPKPSSGSIEKIAAQVIEVKGSLQAKTSDSSYWVTIDPNAQLLYGDQVFVPKKSTTQILLEEKLQIQLAERSLLKIEKSDGRIDIELEYGAIQVATQKARKTKSNPTEESSEPAANPDLGIEVNIRVGDTKIELPQTDSLAVDIDLEGSSLSEIRVHDGEVELESKGSTLVIEENQRAVANEDQEDTALAFTKEDLPISIHSPARDQEFIFSKGSLPEIPVSWTANQDLEIKIQISTDYNFSELEFEMALESDQNSVEVHPALWAGSYYLRLVGEDSEGRSSASELIPIRFREVDNQEMQPQLASEPLSIPESLTSQDEEEELSQEILPKPLADLSLLTPPSSFASQSKRSETSDKVGPFPPLREALVSAEEQEEVRSPSSVEQELATRVPDPPPPLKGPKRWRISFGYDYISGQLEQKEVEFSDNFPEVSGQYESNGYRIESTYLFSPRLHFNGQLEVESLIVEAEQTEDANFTNANSTFNASSHWQVGRTDMTLQLGFSSQFTGYYEVINGRIEQNNLWNYNVQYGVGFSRSLGEQWTIGIQFIRWNPVNQLASFVTRDARLNFVRKLSFGNLKLQYTNRSTEINFSDQLENSVDFRSNQNRLQLLFGYEL